MKGQLSPEIFGILFFQLHQDILLKILSSFFPLISLYYFCNSVTNEGLKVVIQHLMKCPSTENLTDCNKIVWKICFSDIYFPTVFCNFHGLIRKTKEGHKSEQRIRNLAGSGCKKAATQISKDASVTCIDLWKSHF